MTRLKYIGILLLLLGFFTAYGQVGDDTAPMRYSTHTYSITMGQDGNTPLWRIFAGHITANEIESGSFTALTRNTAYTVLSDEITAGDALFTVQFNGNMVAGNYTISYKENNADECFKTELLQIVMQEAFNVDVEFVDGADLEMCPDLSNQPQAPLFTDYQSMIPYRVAMVIPNAATEYVDEWSFKYNISVSSNGGSTDATVNRVEIDFNEDASIDGTDTPAGSVSIYSQTVTVPNQNPNPVSTVILYLYINDVLGEAQNVEIEISSIEGSYLEVDGDASNKISNEIWNMPDVGSITSIN